MVNKGNGGQDIISMLQGGGQDQGSGESCNCAPILKLFKDAIDMLAQSIDELSDEFHSQFGQYDQKTDSYQQVVDALMEIADDEIRQQERGEFDEKYGGQLGECGPDWDNLQSLMPEDKRKSIHDAMFSDLQELRNRKDYNDEMPGQYINDKLGMLKKVREGFKGGGAPVAVKQTSVEAGPGPAQPPVGAAAEGAAFEAPKEEYPKSEGDAKASQEKKTPTEEGLKVDTQPSPKERGDNNAKNEMEVDPEWLKEKAAKAAEVRRMMAERKKKGKK